MALKNAFRATLTVEGSALPADGREWDAFQGGKWSVKETKYTPYNGVQRTYTSLRETENVTLDADYIEDVHGPILAQLNNVEGNANPNENDLRGRECKVVVKDRDANGNWQQNRPPYKGRILEVIGPDGDSNDASTIGKITIVVSVGNNPS